MSFTIFNGFNFGKVQTQNVSAGGGAVGGWVELGRFSGSATTLNVSSLSDKRYYMILATAPSLSTAATSRIRFNNDSGSNYATRISYDGAADVAVHVNYDGLQAKDGSETETGWFDVGYIANYPTKEKLTQMWVVAQNTSGAGTAPTRMERVGKWANTTNAINRITYYFPAGGGITYGANSELVVLGYDPADTHTTNFWEELASDTRTGGSTSTFTSSTFTAKKYLWIQCYIKNGSASARNALFRFNGDSGSNYAHRRSQNGGADSTQTSQSNGIITDGFTNETGFVNMFIINNSANEKLAICHSTFSNTSGAGVAPNRSETVSKWITTGSQITSFSLIDTVSSDAFANGSIIKVYGSN